MRTIKFRMWNPISEKYHYDVENVFNCIAQQNVYNSTMETRGFTPPYDFIGEGYVFEQFTGLKDSFDNEIYEGDKVNIVYTDWPSNTDENISLDYYLDSISKEGFVSFEFDSWVIMLKNRYDELYSSSINPGTYGRIKVIGNIHENK